MLGAPLRRGKLCYCSGGVRVRSLRAITVQKLGRPWEVGAGGGVGAGGPPRQPMSSSESIHGEVGAAVGVT